MKKYILNICLVLILFIGLTLFNGINKNIFAKERNKITMGW